MVRSAAPQRSRCKVCLSSASITPPSRSSAWIPSRPSGSTVRCSSTRRACTRCCRRRWVERRAPRRRCWCSGGPSPRCSSTRGRARRRARAWRRWCSEAMRMRSPRSSPSSASRSPPFRTRHRSWSRSGAACRRNLGGSGRMRCGCAARATCTGRSMRCRCRSTRRRSSSESTPRCASWTRRGGRSPCRRTLTRSTSNRRSCRRVSRRRWR
mmetsp:Transcript_84388/g.214825  ORF Transcript_84388/g.214825 Transcript_84388/m.214825 type:complete len:211 (+) Transcript_84388:94-726(+)